jgi:hypothetical protein
MAAFKAVLCNVDGGSTEYSIRGIDCPSDIVLAFEVRPLASQTRSPVHISQDQFVLELRSWLNGVAVNSSCFHMMPRRSERAMRDWYKFGHAPSVRHTIMWALTRCTICATPFEIIFGANPNDAVFDVEYCQGTENWNELITGAEDDPPPDYEFAGRTRLTVCTSYNTRTNAQYLRSTRQ